VRLRLLPPDRELGFVPYAWIVYSIPFLVSAFLFRMPLGWRAVTIAGWLAFLALYFRGYWVSGRELLPIMAGLVGLGLVFAPYNPAAACFFVYAAAFAGQAGPPRVATRYLLAIVAIVLAQAALVPLPPWTWLPAALVSLIVGGPNIHFAEMARQRGRLRLAQEEVEQMAKLAERERIARDLHDLLGHTLSLIVLKSELAAKLAERDPERAAREIRDVESVSREALAEVRRAVQGYRSRGLAAELEAARRALDAAGVSLDAELPALELPPSLEGVLALALREAATNVVRHSGARSCRVRLALEGGVARLEIRDDGRGVAGDFGAGLAGMRERARALGGDMVREVKDGTRILVQIPLRDAPKAAAATPA